MSREEFSKKVKLEAFTRCKGRCESCHSILRPGHFDYDHDKPDAFGGPATLENCVCLCIACHSHKTRTQDIPRIAKTNRIRKRQAGVVARSRFPGSKDSGWKKRLDGSVVRR